MKKSLLVLMSFILGLSIVSCKQTPKVADATEVAANPQKALTELIEKAKTDGANWSVEEWKDAFKVAMTAVAPTMKEVQSLTKEAVSKDGEPDSTKFVEIMTKLEELRKTYEPIEHLIDQFDSISKSYPNGKTVSEDKEFEKAILNEFGLEDM